jgi:hypothetical protein
MSEFHMGVKRCLSKGSTQLRVFGNRMLNKILRCKRDEATGGWRKIYIEKLHNICSSSNIINIAKLLGWNGQGV